MALNDANVAVGVTGAVMVGAVGATAPTGTASATTGHVDLGWVGEDGVTIALPGTGDAEQIKGWQNGATVRTIRSSSDDNPTVSFVLLETNKDAVELWAGTTVTQSSTEGNYEVDTQNQRVHKSLIVTVVDGANIRRDHIPRGIVSEVGDLVYANGSAIGYEVTIDCERDSTLGYNIKTWDTRLKTVA